MAALVLLIESGLIDRRAAGAVGVANVWGIASWVIASWLAARQRRAIWPEGGWLLNERRLTVDGDGITSEAVRKGCTSTTRYSWRAFSNVSEMAGLMVLWGDGVEDLVVPARALQTRPRVTSSRSPASVSRRPPRRDAYNRFVSGARRGMTVGPLAQQSAGRRGCRMGWHGCPGRPA